MNNVAAVRAVGPQQVFEAAAGVGLPDEVQVALSEIAGVAREGLLALSVSTGLAVMEHRAPHLTGPERSDHNM